MGEVPPETPGLLSSLASILRGLGGAPRRGQEDIYIGGGRSEADVLEEMPAPGVSRQERPLEQIEADFDKCAAAPQYFETFDLTTVQTQGNPVTREIHGNSFSVSYLSGDAVIYVRFNRQDAPRIAFRREAVLDRCFDRLYFDWPAAAGITVDVYADLSPN